MLLINDKKFACESCIKGHRTSSCNHTERPLLEIKRKGRPVSQCEKCRELRKTRRVHSKCLCNEIKAEERNRQDLALAAGSGSKFRRFVPIAPALPNEAKEAPMMEKDGRAPDLRYQVDRLLNPCPCKNVWECQCNRSSGPSGQEGLQALVRAATSISLGPNSVTPQLSGAPSSTQEPPPARKSCCASKPTPRLVNDTGPVRGPDLPPLLLDPDHVIPQLRNGPQFTTPTSIPSIKSIVSLAGTGCCCGFECSCPDCAEHRPLSASARENPNLRSCSDDCPHCVDRLGGVALPEPGSSSQRLSFGSIIETFLSRVATLPPPPTNRSAAIDPTNITVFPTGLFSDDLGGLSDGGRQEQARSAWGLVDIPKLECCGGACGCPDGRCECGNNCSGCCVEGDNPSGSSGSNASVEPASCCTNT